MSVSPQSNSDKSKSFDNPSNESSDKITVYYLDFWFDKTFSTREKIRFFSSALTRFVEVTANCSLNFLDCLPLNGGVILIGVAMLLFYKITNENCLIIIFLLFEGKDFYTILQTLSITQIKCELLPFHISWWRVALIVFIIINTAKTDSKEIFSSISYFLNKYGIGCQ